jgi:hypothetical protein
LEEQIAELKELNRLLTERIDALEEIVGSASSEEVEASTPDTGSSVPEEQLRTKVQQIVRREMRARQEAEGRALKIDDNVTLFGVIEADATVGRGPEGDWSSAYSIDTVELGFDAQLGDRALGHILVSYDDELFVEEASIWIGNQEEWPVLVTAGMFYMPFGDFGTNMIQDPLTLEIGEISALGVAVRFENSGLNGALFSYKGPTGTGAGDSIEGFGGSLGYAWEDEASSVDVGVSAVSNIADAGGIAEILEETGSDSLERLVPGLGLHVAFAAGPWSFVGEYVEALEPFDADQLSFRGRGAEPRAWNLEAARQFELFDRLTVVGLGYQESRESVAIELPENRFNASVAMVLFDGATFTFEVLLDEDYGVADGGTGGDARVYRGQLAYEF